MCTETHWDVPGVNESYDLSIAFPAHRFTIDSNDAITSGETGEVSSAALPHGLHIDGVQRLRALP